APSCAPMGSPLLLVLLAAAASLVVLGALGALWLRRRLQRRQGGRALRRAAKTLRHPVGLAPGVLGLDAGELAGRRHEYFRGIPEQLRALGCDVHVVRVPPVGSVAARAEALAQAVRSLDARRVNIIAHSMGGLDARYA